MFRLFPACFFLCLAFSANAQHQNIKISDYDSPNEPSIAINPKNTNHFVAGSNLNYIYVSEDGARTWTRKAMTSSYGVWGDPVIVFDTAGAVHYFHLSNPPIGGTWIDRIVAQRSDDGGKTWNNGSYMGLNGKKNQDKEWAVVNPFDNTIHVTWTQFDEYGSSKPGDSSIILYSRSEDQGQTWTTAQRISRRAGDCLDNENTVEGSMPAIGPNGELYVTWSGFEKIYMQKSLDGGKTWLSEEREIATQPGGWTFDIPGIMRCNGLPVIKCDLSNGPDHGTLYVNWSDQRHGTTDTDIWFIKSTDGGETWSQPKRVNNDNSEKHQFFTWMEIDQTTGELYFVFYDRRNQANNLTDVFMAYSKDGGETFSNFRISESPFNPNPSVFFGDYTNVAAHNGVVRPVWTRLDGGKLSLWTAIIDSQHMVNIGQPDLSSFKLDQNFPNPFDDVTYISFKLNTPAEVSLDVYDLTGQKVITLIQRKNYAPGKYIESFNARNLGLSSGTYVAVLKCGGKENKRKMVYVR